MFTITVSEDQIKLIEQLCDVGLKTGGLNNLSGVLSVLDALNSRRPELIADLAAKSLEAKEPTPVSLISAVDKDDKKIRGKIPNEAMKREDYGKELAEEPNKEGRA
jgi:hypothetical protein